MAGREIRLELIDYIDERLKNNPLAKLAIDQKDPRTLMVEAAKICVGIKEKTGKNDGPLVNLFQDTVGGISNEYWCMSFVQSMIAYAEVKTGIDSPLIASELCSAVWHKSPKASRVKIAPLAGAVIIFADVKKGKVLSTGHTEILLSTDGKTIQAIGGNTSGTLKQLPSEGVRAVDRNGNGVWYTVRSTKGTASRKILGYLIPFPAAKKKA